MNAHPMLRWALTLLGFGVSLAFLYLAVRNVVFGVFGHELGASHYWWVLPSLAALAVAVSLRVLRGVCFLARKPSEREIGRRGSPDRRVLQQHPSAPCGRARTGCRSTTALALRGLPGGSLGSDLLRKRPWCRSPDLSTSADHLGTPHGRLTRAVMT
jgi:hypothetical protein